jgi:hypothetical protein
VGARRRTKSSSKSSSLSFYIPRTPNEKNKLINREQLDRYGKFAGDLDKWIASQKKGMDEALSGNDWTLIDKVIQRLKLQKSGFASNDYREETERVLLKTFGDAEIIKAARAMV